MMRFCFMANSFATSRRPLLSNPSTARLHVSDVPAFHPRKAFLAWQQLPSPPPSPPKAKPLLASPPLQNFHAPDDLVKAIPAWTRTLALRLPATKERRKENLVERPKHNQPHTPLLPLQFLRRNPHDGSLWNLRQRRTDHLRINYPRRRPLPLSPNQARLCALAHSQRTMPSLSGLIRNPLMTSWAI